MMRRAKAKGHRGSWFAEVDGELLPCVHQHWRRGFYYDDPYVERHANIVPARQEGGVVSEKPETLLGRAALWRDTVASDNGGGG
jgi:hypothetical protein